MPRPTDDGHEIPRWVKIFGGVLLALILVFVIVQLTGLGGPHGPGRHESISEPA